MSSAGWREPINYDKKQSISIEVGEPVDTQRAGSEAWAETKASHR
jgi:hypothetical protein